MVRCLCRFNIVSFAFQDACKITAEVLNGIMTQVIKDKLFNHGARTGGGGGGGGGPVQEVEGSAGQQEKMAQD